MLLQRNLIYTGIMRANGCWYSWAEAELGVAGKSER
jgi:hypothetical protein